jgi:hypothetical protein
VRHGGFSARIYADPSVTKYRPRKCRQPPPNIRLGIGNEIPAEEHAMNIVAWSLYVGIATSIPILIKDDFKDKAACGVVAELILRSAEYHVIGQSGQYGKSAPYGLTALCLPVIKERSAP